MGAFLREEICDEDGRLAWSAGRFGGAGVTGRGDFPGSAGAPRRNRI
jgi:hypothetical protein